ncbi:HemK family protein methyltransferase [Spiroplasma endosymbiont of Aspidapion aeneum]|uniref:HemK family protein methyltransferase n=1 Tax=Spiroplasma endosymbiont of Aspidapion aeneum TaxID=3066276 RepID=UPI00313D4EF6
MSRYHEIESKYLLKFRNRHDFNSVISFLNDKIFITKDDMIFNENDERIISHILKRYNNNEPLPYILRRVFFYKSYFNIKKGVFIPRQDSEAMIEDIITNNKPEKVCEFFCGSGALGLSVLNNVQLKKLELIDICKKALKCAKSNIKEGNVLVLRGYFEKLIITKSKNFDLIILNPPYIDINDINVSQSVKEWEPHKAIFSKDNGLYYFNILFSKISECFSLNKKLKIYCEFGYRQKNDISKMVPHDIKVTYKKDYQKNWRYFILESKND